MLLKILACSTDGTTQETLNDWAAQHPMVELHSTSSPEDLSDLLSSDAFNALILDGSDPEVSFTELMPRLALIPGMKILLIASQANGLTEKISFPNPVDVLQKPVTGENLSAALHALIIATQSSQPTAAREEFPAAGLPDAEDDISYLKDWIAEDAPETPPPTDVVNEESPQLGEIIESTDPPIQDNGLSSVTSEFSCVILPRDPQWFLTHALAERLAISLPWIHAKNGWQLIGISIRPQYLQWSMALPAATSPTSAIQEIMRLTSEQLIETFPDLQNDVPNEGIWSNDYLVVSGTQSTTYSMIKAFIDRTRLSQSRGE